MDNSDNPNGPEATGVASAAHAIEALLTKEDGDSEPNQEADLAELEVPKAVAAADEEFESGGEREEEEAESGAENQHFSQANTGNYFGNSSLGMGISPLQIAQALKQPHLAAQLLPLLPSPKDIPYHLLVGGPAGAGPAGGANANFGVFPQTPRPAVQAVPLMPIEYPGRTYGLLQIREADIGRPDQ